MRKSFRSYVTICIFLCMIFCLGSGVYFGKCWYDGYLDYYGRYLDGTVINGVDFSGMKPELAAFSMKLAEDAPVVIVPVYGNIEQLSTSDFELMRSVDENLLLMMANIQNFENYKQSRYEQIRVPVTLSMNVDNVDKFVDNFLFVCNGEKPVNSEIAFGNFGFFVTESSNGTFVDRKTVASLVSMNVMSRRHMVCIPERFYAKADVIEEDLQDEANRLNAVWNRSISVHFSEDVQTITPEDLFSWMTWDGEEIAFDSEKVDSWTESVSEKYTTYGSSRRFETSPGTVLMVGGSYLDNYGWILDMDATKESVRHAVTEGLSDCDCVWKRTEFVPFSAISDLAETYVEVSIEQQHMWYYKDGDLILDTDVTTGLPGRDTPKGVFRIQGHYRDYTMRGSYGEAFAHFVMPINDAGICIHDASWRSLYGGTYYLTDGSHGCINTPYDAVKMLFEDCPDGVPVVVY